MKSIFDKYFVVDEIRKMQNLLEHYEVDYSCVGKIDVASFSSDYYTEELGEYADRLQEFFVDNLLDVMHRPILFNELVLSDKLFEHCAEIEEAARNRMELIVRSLAEQNGVTEQLKAENQMEWVRQMNACKAQAEEVVKAELIYN